MVGHCGCDVDGACLSCVWSRYSADLIVCYRVSSSSGRTEREGVAGGQTGSQSRSWVYDNSNSIELASSGLWESLPVGTCVCV